MTSFSILFSRIKGDLRTFYRSAKSIDSLDEGDRILIYESCTHHPIEDDIARVKIPAWLKKATGIKNLYFDYHSSSGFEKNIEKYSLIIQCGGCMTNRREILSRINFAIENHVPITNYGLAIAHCLGILPRAVEIFKNEIYE